MKLAKAWGLSLALVLGACAGGPPVMTTGDRYNAVHETTDTYRLGSEDKIRIAIYNEPQLSGDYIVGSDGTIALPLIGDINIGGKSTSDAAIEIQNALSRGFLHNPRVAITMEIYRPIYIIGEVKLPGTYPYSPGISAWDAIAKGGGLTPRGKRGQIWIRKPGEQAETLYALKPSLRVYPGDTIRVPERFF